MACGATGRATSGSPTTARTACTVTAACSDSTRRRDAPLSCVSIGTTWSRLRLRRARSRRRAETTIRLLDIILSARQTGSCRWVRRPGNTRLPVDAIALHTTWTHALIRIGGGCRFTDTVDIAADLLAIFFQVSAHLVALLLQRHALLLGKGGRRNSCEQQHQR